MPARSRALSAPLQPALLAALRAQLAEGEQLAWAGSPEPSVAGPARVGKWDALAILGGGYGVLGSGVMIARTGRWLWLSLPAALLVLGIAAYAISRVIAARARRTREGRVYGLTTRRALIVHTYPELQVQMLPIEAIEEIDLRDEQAEVADLALRGAQVGSKLVFEAIYEPERIRKQLLRVIREPQAAEEQIAAAEAYAAQMRQLMVRSAPP